MLQDKVRMKYENENLDDFLKKLTSLLQMNSKNSMFFCDKKVYILF